MKTMKNSIITKTVIIAALLLIVPMLAMAKGRMENQPDLLIGEITRLAKGIEAEEIEAGEAIEQLNQFRIENSKEYSEDYKAIEGILHMVQEKTMTAEHAVEQASQLAVCVQEQSKLQLKEQTQEKVQSTSPVQTQTQTKSATQTQSQLQPSTTAQESSGNSDADKSSQSGNSSKAKGKN